VHGAHRRHEHHLRPVARQCPGESESRAAGVDVEVTCGETAAWLVMAVPEQSGNRKKNCKYLLGACARCAGVTGWPDTHEQVPDPLRQSARGDRHPRPRHPWRPAVRDVPHVCSAFSSDARANGERSHARRWPLGASPTQFLHTQLWPPQRPDRATSRSRAARFDDGVGLGHGPAPRGYSARASSRPECFDTDLEHQRLRDGGFRPRRRR